MKKRIDLMILLISEGRRKPSVAKTISFILQYMITQLKKLFEEQIHLVKMRTDVDPQTAAMAFLGFLSYYSLMKEMFDDKLIKHDKKFLMGLWIFS
jgi:hypothetical protein